MRVISRRYASDRLDGWLRDACVGGGATTRPGLKDESRPCDLDLVRSLAARGAAPSRALAAAAANDRAACCDVLIDLGADAKVRAGNPPWREVFRTPRLWRPFGPRLRPVSSDSIRVPAAASPRFSSENQRESIRYTWRLVGSGKRERRVRAPPAPRRGRRARGRRPRSAPAPRRGPVAAEPPRPDAARLRPPRRRGRGRVGRFRNGGGRRARPRVARRGGGGRRGGGDRRGGEIFGAAAPRRRRGDAGGPRRGRLRARPHWRDGPDDDGARGKRRGARGGARAVGRFGLRESVDGLQSPARADAQVDGGEGDENSRRRPRGAARQRAPRLARGGRTGRRVGWI